MTALNSKPWRKQYKTILPSLTRSHVNLQILRMETVENHHRLNPEYTWQKKCVRANSGGKEKWNKNHSCTFTLTAFEPWQVLGFSADFTTTLFYAAKIKSFSTEVKIFLTLKKRTFLILPILLFYFWPKHCFSRFWCPVVYWRIRMVGIVNGQEFRLDSVVTYKCPLQYK